MNKNIRIIIFSITSVLVIAGGFWFTNKYLNENDMGILVVDLDDDGNNERYELDEGVLRVTEGGLELWTSPIDWKIEIVTIGDIDNDTFDNILLSVWKPGNFGASKPFWVKENDMGIRNHLFVYEFEDDTLHSVWQSSNLVRPNCSIQIKDLDKNGSNELVVTEGDYDKDDVCGDAQEAVWKWIGWGFSKVE